MGEAKVWVEQVIIPTYEIGEAVNGYIREAAERSIPILRWKKSAIRRRIRNIPLFFWKMNM